MSMTARVCTSLATVAIVVALAGCTPTHIEAPSVAPSATPSATQSATPSAPSKVYLLANGDCKKLLNPLAVAATLGGKKHAEVHSGDPLISIVGGIECDYYVGKSDDFTGYVGITIAPSAIVEPNALEKSLAPEDCDITDQGSDANSGCRATATVGGWWYNLTVYSFVSVKEERAGFTAITAKLEQRLAAAKAPTQVSRIRPFDCTTAETADVPVTRQRTFNYEWQSLEGPAAEIYAASFLLAGPATCTFTMHNGKSWFLTVYPGNAAIYEQCWEPSGWGLAGTGESEAMSLEGVKAAYGQPATDDGAQICATDGQSTIKASGAYDIDFTAKSRAFLSSILVPVFAAARTSNLAPPPSVVPSTNTSTASSTPFIAGSGEHGPCEKLLATKAVSAAMGGSTYAYVGTGDPLLAFVGGVECQYFFGKGDPESDDEFTPDEVYVAVAPRAIADPSALAASLAPENCAPNVIKPGPENAGCTATVAIGGWW
jgi:hypothetical protein